MKKKITLVLFSFFSLLSIFSYGQNNTSDLSDVFKEEDILDSIFQHAVLSPSLGSNSDSVVYYYKKGMEYAYKVKDRKRMLNANGEYEVPSTDDYINALFCMNKAIKYAPNAFFFLLRADIKHQLNDYMGEIDDYRQVFIYCTPSAAMYLRFGEALSAQKQYEEVAEVYKEGISKYPKNNDLYFGLKEINKLRNGNKETDNTASDTITFYTQGSFSIMAAPGFEFTIINGKQSKSVIGKGFSKGDAMTYEIPAKEDRAITIVGDVANLLFASEGDLSYKYHLREQGEEKTLLIFVNSLSQLDISRNNSLIDVLCREWQLTRLDVSHNTNLERLDCSNNPLKVLDLHQNTNLRILSCSNNDLVDIDVSHNVMLEYLVCFDNNNSSLDVSANKSLEFLSCDGLLKELDVSNNPDLKSLICRNKLTELDLSKNKKIRELRIDGNSLSAEGLNALFKTLPDIDFYEEFPQLDYEQNPGAEECDRSILQAKGWAAPESDEGY